MEERWRRNRKEDGEEIQGGDQYGFVTWASADRYTRCTQEVQERSDEDGNDTGTRRRSHLHHVYTVDIDSGLEMLKRRVPTLKTPNQ